MSDDLRRQIREFIQKELLLDSDGTTISDDTALLDEALIDSLGVFSLAGFLEKQFGIQIRDEEMVPDHFGSIRSLALLVEAKRGGAGAA